MRMNLHPALVPALDLLFGAGAIAIGTKFLTYFDHTVYFPLLPNILDTVFLVLAGGYLVGRGTMSWAFGRRRFREDTLALSAMGATMLMVILLVVLGALLYFLIGWAAR